MSNRMDLNVMSNYQDLDDNANTYIQSNVNFDNFTNDSSYYPVNFAPEGLRQDRGGQRTLFQQLEVTKENCETYFVNTNGPRKIANKYYQVLAQHVFENKTLKGFLAEDFIQATSSPTEIVAVWALMDLPYKSVDHKYTAQGGRSQEIEAQSNMIIFKKEIRESEAELEDNLLVIHRFFEYNNQLSDTKIKEFLTNSVYGCEIIITNVSSKKQ